MKKFFSLALCIISFCIANETIAQTGSSDITTMQNSSYYHYAGNQYQGYKPAYSPSGGGAMEVMQGRYDYAFEILSKEFNKLRQLTLINTQNQQLLLDYKTQSAFLEKTKASFSRTDISKESTFNYWYQMYTVPYGYESIRSELLLLASLNTELSRIMRANPDTFTESKRFQKLIELFAELRNCNANQIEGLRLKYGLF